MSFDGTLLYPDDQCGTAIQVGTYRTRDSSDASLLKTISISGTAGSLTLTTAGVYQFSCDTAFRLEIRHGNQAPTTVTTSTGKKFYENREYISFFPANTQISAIANDGSTSATVEFMPV
jgi:hypothetical protein